MKRYQQGNTIVGLVVMLLWMIGAGGWIWNIVKIVGSNFDVISGLLVIRIIGIFVAPLGCVVGYL